MKVLRIIPGISGLVAVWFLEEKKWNKWVQVFRHEDIAIVKKMKDHLLQRPTIYTRSNHLPEKPLRTRPSSWLVRTKTKYLKIKRSDIPESLT